jgi:hypothetical protein
MLYNVTEFERLQFHQYGKSAIQITVVFEYLGRRECDVQTCCTESWGYSLTNKLCKATERTATFLGLRTPFAIDQILQLALF